MKESKFTKKICNEISVFGTVVRYVNMEMNQTGVPDRYIHTKLWCGWLEFKAERTPLTPMQKHTIDMFNKIVPCSAFVIRESITGNHKIQNTNKETLATFVNGKQLLDHLYKLKVESYYD